MSAVYSSAVYVKGDTSTTPLWFGIPYNTLFRLSPLVLRQPSQTGGVEAKTDGRLQVKTLGINYANTGYFRVEVTPQLRDKLIHIFTPRIIRTDPVVDTVETETGRKMVLIQSKADTVQIDLVNDSFLPSWFVSADWQGDYMNRNR